MHTASRVQVDREVVHDQLSFLDEGDGERLTDQWGVYDGALRVFVVVVFGHEVWSEAKEGLDEVLKGFVVGRGVTKVVRDLHPVR